MDSLTQIVLGASVGQATGGRQLGRLAPIWGGICGLLPDLDMLVPQAGPVESFTYHRSWSHSFLVLTLATPLLVAVARRIHGAEHAVRWHLLVFLSFVTHVLLDCCTVYGTQIFWPFDPTPVAWSTVFIIDPVYTVPLLAGVALAMARPAPRFGHRCNSFALAFSTLYLGWGACAKLWVDGHVRESLAKQGIVANRVLTAPAPLQTLLWRVLVVDEDAYYEGFYSLLDRGTPVAFTRYPTRPRLLDGVRDEWAVRRLEWFTRGFYRVSEEDGAVVLTDLRMGMEPDYVFRFKVGVAGETTRPMPVEQLESGIDWRRLGEVWDRMVGVSDVPPRPGRR